MPGASPASNTLGAGATPLQIRIFCAYGRTVSQSNTHRNQYAPNGQKGDTAVVIETYKGKACRKAEMQIGETMFTVISVQSEAAKETAYEKVKKLVLNSTQNCPEIFAHISKAG